MLYVISQPVGLIAGNYCCKQIDADTASELIRKAYPSSELRSLVHFGSTVFALKELTSIDIELVDQDRAELPPLRDGDCFIDVRLKIGTPRGKPVGLLDLEFWQVNYNKSDLDDYEKIKESAEWPAIIRQSS